MSWLILFLAGLFEIAWSVGLKSLDGSNRPWLLSACIVSIILSMGLLSLAMKNLPLGTAYAIWTGIGALGSFAAGVILFQEPLNAGRTISMLFLLLGIIGLKLSH
ncbi:MAG: multidrug efflux SMR transporter [Candidatus Obscuribacterales bacterium]|nr:multidrug efflux SMR transporter [Candidatus Obscuribacterales bacterium]